MDTKSSSTRLGWGNPRKSYAFTEKGNNMENHKQEMHNMQNYFILYKKRHSGVFVILSPTKVIYY